MRPQPVIRLLHAATLSLLAACASPLDEAAESDLPDDGASEPLAQLAGSTVIMTGTGCSSTVDPTSISADGLAVTAELPRLKTPSSTASTASSKCSIKVTYNLPAGRRIGVEEVFADGDIALQGGSSAKATMTSWSEAGRGAPVSATYNGPKTDHFYLSDKVRPYASRCGGRQTIGTDVDLNVTRPGGQRGTIGGNVTVKLKLRMEKC
ncbi:MAG: DUF4360 domain-containing protein [Polyangiales bacterium]